LDDGVAAAGTDLRDSDILYTKTCGSFYMQKCGSIEVLTGTYEKPLFCDNCVSAMIGPLEEIKNDRKKMVVHK
jgi:hypothetical protein